MCFGRVERHHPCEFDIIPSFIAHVEVISVISSPRTVSTAVGNEEYLIVQYGIIFNAVYGAFSASISPIFIEKKSEEPDGFSYNMALSLSK